MWRITRGRGAATLIIEPDGSWSKADQLAVADEGDRMLVFLAAYAEDRDVRFTKRA